MKKYRSILTFHERLFYFNPVKLTALQETFAFFIRGFFLGSYTRRSFLKHSAIGTIGSIAAMGFSCSGQGNNLADAYRASAANLLQTIIKSETATIRDASNHIAESLIAKNRWFLSAENNGPRPFLPDRYPGFPPHMYFYLASRAMAFTVREGDTIVAMTAGNIPAAGRKHGASVVGISTPALADEYDPALFTKPVKINDLATILIRSHLPVWDGLVEIPGQTGAVFPGSGIALQTLFSALTGESYYRSGGTNRTDTKPPNIAVSFFRHVIRRIQSFSEQRELLAETANTLAESIKAGGRLYVYDPRDIITRDITFGAGIPLMIAPTSADLIKKGLLSKHDTLVLSLSSKLSSGEYSVLSSAMEKSGRIILLHSPRLTDSPDIVKKAVSLDNFSPEADGIISFDNGARKFLSTAGIINTLLFWSLAAEVTDRFVQEGKPPSFLMNSNLTGSDRHNTEARALHKKQGW